MCMCLYVLYAVCSFRVHTRTRTRTRTQVFFVLFVANRQPRNCYCNEATMNKKLVVVFTHSNEQEMCVTVCICVHLIFFPSTNCNTFSCNLHICRNQEIYMYRYIINFVECGNINTVYTFFLIRIFRVCRTNNKKTRYRG